MTELPLLVLNVTATSTPFKDTQSFRKIMMKNVESRVWITQETVIVYVGFWPERFASLFL